MSQFNPAREMAAKRVATIPAPGEEIWERGRALFP